MPEQRLPSPDFSAYLALNSMKYQKTFRCDYLSLPSGGPDSSSFRLIFIEFTFIHSIPGKLCFPLQMMKGFIVNHADFLYPQV